MLNRPNAHAGLRHLALFVANFDEALHFYTELLGMAVEWQPDPDNIYLCSGCDNLALHRYQGGERPVAGQRLDHLGFVIDRIDDVDAWHAFLLENGVAIKAEPRTHRDGARSFYCLDPDGNLVQMIYHPPISARTV
ncbi:catechol 2,3-dioxygenase-like lactoylglutathione lyase family enzyme [Zhongshania antarctica]|jgi:catechol 2,3-dioxygenase-like lactoylglutathione lyase family enzyme|uniref:Catechol 2,3-dioxygenase-like lactoylglutathione lyase family enzyme n=1 Tax=Zhongshania antarctica TaxID=641702 RepID=A0A840R5W4_9GAMM|nr:VOC family protein [Zhongshania antarctica]MBB5188679.1 catechol 2,3-dioxygenase-like lactoylglutathione lyase family enzyme [Zhongshania antarctica]